METANKSSPTTNKATMGNQTSSSSTSSNDKKTPHTNSASTDEKMKAKSNIIDSPKQSQNQRDQSNPNKKETKEAPKSPRDQNKVQKADTTSSNSKAQAQPTTTAATTATPTNTTTSTTTTAAVVKATPTTAAPLTATKTTTTATTTPTPSSQQASTKKETNNASSTDTNSAKKDDMPPLPTAHNGDKMTNNQDNSSKNQKPAGNETTSNTAVQDDNSKLLEPNSAGSFQHFQRTNKALHNAYHPQHQHNSQPNQQHQQQPQQQQQQQQQQQHQQQHHPQHQQQHPHPHHNNSNQYHSHFQQHHHQHLQHQGAEEQLSKTNLYIRGLNADTSDSDLYTLCNRFGSIVSTKAILDKSTNKCKGYGFVDFDNPASAELAVVELQKQGILVHMAKQQEADPTNLYLANLPQTMTESDLENLLRPYGQVVSTRILINQNRQPRGVGFARMETKEQCDSIIALLNGQVIKGSKEPLLVKFADGANKKRPHHFQHKPLGGNLFMGGSHMRRNNGNDTNHYHMMNSGASGNRNFHGGSFLEHSRQNHNLTHHDNGIIKHQQMLTSMPGYHPHQSGSHPSYMMMGPTSAVDPSMHYVNLANQMQGLQIGNHPVSGYMSPQQWPPVWPPGSSSAFSNTSNTSRDAVLR